MSETWDQKLRKSSQDDHSQVSLNIIKIRDNQQICDMSHDGMTAREDVA